MKISKELKHVARRRWILVENRAAELMLAKGICLADAIEDAEDWVADQCQQLGGLDELEKAINDPQRAPC